MLIVSTTSQFESNIISLQRCSHDWQPDVLPPILTGLPTEGHTVDNEAWLAPPSHIKTTSIPTEYMHSFFFSREKSKKTRIFYRCLAASNFPSGHPWEPYIFTYGKLSLGFMGWIVLGSCEKRRSKTLTVCGKTERDGERCFDPAIFLLWHKKKKLWAVFLIHIEM